MTLSGRRQRKDGSLFPVEVRARAFNRSGRLFAIALASNITRHREQRLLAQFSVTRTLSEVGSLEEAAPRILREMCEALEWDHGTFWRVDPEADVLVRVRAWPSPPQRGPAPSCRGRPASAWAPRASMVERRTRMHTRHGAHS